MRRLAARSLVARTWALSVGIACFASSLPTRAAPPKPTLVELAPEEDPATAAARRAYEAGEKEYRLGQFEEAAREFERAYELSALPAILYNIGLAHLRWYDVDPDIAHLRKAKVVFQNYIIELQKNPELGDIAEAEAVIAEIDKKIADHEAAEATVNEPKPEPVDLGPDPGKKLRLGGAVAMGLGGVFVIGGVVSGVVLGVRGQGFEDELRTAFAERRELMCASNDLRPECAGIQDDIDASRENGRKANTLAVALSLTFGGVGVLGLIAGAVLFVRGNKKTQAWELERSMSVSPTWLPGGGGLTVVGRF